MQNNNVEHIVPYTGSESMDVPPHYKRMWLSCPQSSAGLFRFTNCFAYLLFLVYYFNLSLFIVTCRLPCVHSSTTLQLVISCSGLVVSPTFVYCLLLKTLSEHTNL